MSDFKRKLREIQRIKNEIKNALLTKGATINDDTPYSEFPTKILEINTAINLPDPTIEYFIVTRNADLTISIAAKFEDGVSSTLENKNEYLPIVVVNGELATTIPPGYNGDFKLKIYDRLGNTAERGSYIDPLELLLEDIYVSQDGKVKLLFNYIINNVNNLNLILSVNQLAAIYETSIHENVLTIITNPLIQKDDSVEINYISGIFDFLSNEATSFNLAIENHSIIENNYDERGALVSGLTRITYKSIKPLTTINTRISYESVIDRLIYNYESFGLSQELGLQYAELYAEMWKGESTKPQYIYDHYDWYVKSEIDEFGIPTIILTTEDHIDVGIYDGLVHIDYLTVIHHYDGLIQEFEDLDFEILKRYYIDLNNVPLEQYPSMISKEYFLDEIYESSINGYEGYSFGFKLTNDKPNTFIYRLEYYLNYTDAYYNLNPIRIDEIKVIINAPNLTFTEYEIATTEIPGLIITRSTDDFIIQYNSSTENKEIMPIIYVDGRKIDSHFIDDYIKVSLSISKNFNHDIRIKFDGQSGQRNYLINNDYTGFRYVENIYRNSTLILNSDKINTDMGIRYYFIDPITFEKKSGVILQNGSKLSDTILTILNEVAPNSFIATNQENGTFFKWLDAKNSPIILLCDIDDIPIYYFTFIGDSSI